MVRKLGPPPRPLSRVKDGAVWFWEPPESSSRWGWCRIYHQGAYSSTGVSFRQFGPLSRFDHHHPAQPPAVDPTGRRVLYVGEDLATSACEVFGYAGIATICPRYRVAIVTPTKSLPMYDLAAKGSAMAIGALPALGDGDEPRWLTQQWARAVYEDQPVGDVKVAGIHYLSGYNSGQALALWDCDREVDVLHDETGEPQDLALDDARILLRLQTELRWRQINVTTVSSADCAECRKEGSS